MIAAGLAELRDNVSALADAYGTSVEFLAYLSTTLNVLISTATSSLIRCGLLPVFSSCLRTATTTSSLTPSVSSLVSWCELGGDGGGVCSAAGPAGRPADKGGVRDCRLAGDARDTADDEDAEGVTELRVCDRLMRLGGGAMSDVEAVRLCEREAPLPGRCTPSDGRLREIRRVLYGILLNHGMTDWLSRTTMMKETMIKRQNPTVTVR